MSPPLFKVGDKHVHYEIMSPVLDVVILPWMKESPELHLEQAVGRLSRLKANVQVKLLAGFVVLCGAPSGAWPSRCFQGRLLSLTRKPPAVRRRLHLSATLAVLLGRRTRHRAKRAKNATVARFGFEADATALAVVKELAGVGRHRLCGGVST